MTSHPLLQVEALHKQFGNRITAAGIDLCVGHGQFFTLLGPSGSGKSTVLRMIAGLEASDGGRIVIDRKDVTNRPAWERGLGMVFQQYANFPHMNVSDNIAYGLRRQGLSATAIRQRVSDLLKLIDLPGYGGRRVTGLSGGEQQRVAIARALAPRPRLLLLDEPLSALDERVRREMQAQLKTIQRATETAFVYVTHDQEEALTMSDQVAVLNGGHLVQVDEPHVLFRRPKTRFVATFFRGSNVIEGHLDTDRRLFVCSAFTALLPDIGPKAVEGSAVAIRSEHIQLNPPEGSDDVRFEAIFDASIYRGTYTDYRFRLADGQSITASLTAGPELTPGQPVLLAVRLKEIVALRDGRL